MTALGRIVILQVPVAVDDHILSGSLCRREHRLKVVRVDPLVSIHVIEVLPLSLVDGEIPGIRDAMVLRKGDHPDPPILRRTASKQLRGPVSRAIINA